MVASLRKELQELQEHKGPATAAPKASTTTAATQTDSNDGVEPAAEGAPPTSLAPRPPASGSARGTPTRRAVKLYKRDVSDPLVDSINNTLRSVGSADDTGRPLN